MPPQTITNTPPPPYKPIPTPTPTLTKTPTSKPQPTQNTNPSPPHTNPLDKPTMHHTLTSTSNLKHKWRSLKQSNAQRKATNKITVSHEEATRISGHDRMGFDMKGGSGGGMTREEWERVREGRERAGVVGLYG